jgi:WXG100 family type VII secretion target
VGLNHTTTEKGSRMSAPFQSVDFDANQKTMTAMDDAIANCNQAKSAVASAASYLETHWKGGAAQQFNQSITTWTQGLDKVVSALNEMAQSVANYHQVSTQIEGDNSQVATWI